MEETDEIIELKLDAKEGPFKRLVKATARFSRDSSRAASDAEREKAFDVFAREVEVYRTVLIKAERVAAAQDANEKALGVLRETAAHDNEEARRGIAVKKAELEEARREQADKEECELLAREVNKHPSRTEIQAALSKAKSESQRADERLARLETAAQQRSKQLSLLLCAFDEVQHMLRDDDIADYSSSSDDEDADDGKEGKVGPGDARDEEGAVATQGSTADTDAMDQDP